MGFIGYRNIIVEEKIEECLSAYRHGETSISLNEDILTKEEAQSLRREVKLRKENENNYYGYGRNPVSLWCC